VTEIVTGKPVASGGTEGRREATGRGVGFLVERACQRIGLEPNGATAIVQGFGNVGSVAAQSLADRGVKVIGISDHTACYFDRRGLDIAALTSHATRRGALRGYANEMAFDPRELLTQPCDILVPAAMERVIDGATAGKLRCRVLAEGANGPTMPDADLVLDGRRDEVFVIPDILCNAGGVVVSYFEWVQDLQQFFWDEAEVMTKLYHVLQKSFAQVMARAERDGVSHRTAAMAIGVEKVQNAKETRGLVP
jgi:glutamate dehydrogenase (NAD(P)+)